MEKKTGNGRIPRYEKPGFQEIRTPDSPGMIKRYQGGRMFGGVIRYPRGVEVDLKRAARAQALMDYNSAAGNAQKHREDMAEIYGEAYTKEIKRLKTTQNGPSAWRGGKHR